MRVQIASTRSRRGKMRGAPHKWIDFWLASPCYFNAGQFVRTFREISSQLLFQSISFAVFFLTGANLRRKTKTSRVPFSSISLNLVHFCTFFSENIGVCIRTLFVVYEVCIAADGRFCSVEKRAVGQQQSKTCCNIDWVKGFFNSQFLPRKRRSSRSLRVVPSSLPLCPTFKTGKTVYGAQQFFKYNECNGKIHDERCCSALN